MDSFLYMSVVVFGQIHLLTLAMIIGLVAWILVASKRATTHDRKTITYILSVALLCCYPLSLIYRLILTPDVPWLERLPFELCSIVPYVGAYALMTRSPFASAVTYYLGALLCAQALITPALRLDFPHPVYMEFMGTHTVIILAALYLPIVMGWRSQKRDFLRVYLFALGYMIFALGVNVILGTNYGFVMHAPAGGSVLDLLGPWPWYLLAMQPIAILLLWLMGLPVRRR